MTPPRELTVTMKLTEAEAAEVYRVRQAQDEAFRLYHSKTPRGRKFKALVDKIERMG